MIGCRLLREFRWHMTHESPLSSTIFTWVIAVCQQESEAAVQQWRQTLQLWLSLFGSKDEGKIHWQSVTTNKQAVAKITHIFVELQWCKFHKYRASCNIWLEIRRSWKQQLVTRAALHISSITYDSDVVSTYYVGGTNTTVKALLVKRREYSGQHCMLKIRNCCTAVECTLALPETSQS